MQTQMTNPARVLDKCENQDDSCIMAIFAKPLILFAVLNSAAALFALNAPDLYTKSDQNITGDSRVLAYFLVPDGPGPHPAVLLLHDHGAEFRIGKEKSVEPWDVPANTAALAREWVDKVYDGRFVGDELAARGYVVLVYDVLNWSDRGGAGFEGQQSLASNLLHLGMSFAGLIAYEDLRGAEFLASRPEVDKDRIAAMGHSMGAFRTWQVAAMSDHIAAGVSCCWMATNQGLMVPGNNRTRGHSAFTMTHPGLFNDLDYPDVASLACPKPMLLFAGEQDALFPVLSVRDAFEKMHQVWQSQGAGGNLVIRLVPVPHTFNAAMQDEAFTWLDQNLRPQIASGEHPANGAENVASNVMLGWLAGADFDGGSGDMHQIYLAAGSSPTDLPGAPTAATSSYGRGNELK